MAVKIRLTRMGKIRAPFYRVVVADSRTRRDGKAIEQIGIYHPTRNPSVIEIDSERAQHWLSVGAQPTDQVRTLLKLTGDWQKHTGVGEAVNTVKPQPEKEAYVAPTAGSVIKEAITPKGSDKAAEAPAESAEEAAPAASEESAEA
ncbi:MAG: 30S ribosomal protein S16 [Brevibacterium aurantiacum]|uniref:Small ribosomal subunit protein bS16 n=1 Tax=Brevibacterium aurantiacum TaxID=273384 RepID=A0A1D7W5M2_BREAU|nr:MULTISPECIES: 30S ribosomal protein S16 [Brevibacterium]MDN5549791.1 30S ribosomal protein S16 [Brevibacterium sp.]AOP54291.1 SSU ribosomal protein S16p [Brevibacterium aurantiacum]AZL06353.1 30S ribosomal protein S16 [Brevibacterium aurantiacum]AZL09914.1 30S ribosomal protein S16 [Brevibacterium aurantiacum]AZL13564.1 30S ribosomal protein S16 [Brevibacterium aurantiacum]